MAINFFLPRDPADPYKFRNIESLSTAEIDQALHVMEYHTRQDGVATDAFIAMIEIQRELLRRSIEKEEKTDAP